MDVQDPYDLDRFLEAQDPVYARVCAELSAGRKQSHWMWFIFPQIQGLGRSRTANIYAIHSRKEAEAYLAHPVLGARLLECTRIVIGLPGNSAHAIFGSPDDLKFRSSMTLFAQACGGEEFSAALHKFFRGEPDPQTLEILAGQAAGRPES